MKTHKPARLEKTDISGHKQEITVLLPKFISLVSKRLGIFIHNHQMAEMEKIIHHACQEFEMTPSVYLQNLEKCREDSPFLTFLISGITIGETYFFRDKRQMDLLENTILPTLIRAKRQKNDLSLRIWSAGCSSGEEIYTIVMMLRELLPDIERWSLHLLGTDINTVMLKKAVIGHYSEWSMRSIPRKFKQSYFLAEKNGYTLLPAVGNIPEFNYLNLNDDTWPSMLNGTHALDLILCRNVLIYFNSESTAKLMKKMRSSLVEGGYLLLGASDPVSTKTEGLHFHHTQGMLFSRIQLGQEKTEKSAPRALSPFQTRHEVAPDIQKIKPSTAPSSAAQAIDISQVQEMLKAGRWQDIISITECLDKDSSRNMFLINARAKALTSLGQLKDAVLFCHQYIAENSENFELMLIHSMALAELNQSAEAEAELRKILYLDHQCVMAHYQLGLLLIRNKKRSAGLKCLRNATGIAASRQAGERVPGVENLNYGHLTEILAREIEIHSATGGNTDVSARKGK